MPSSLANSNTCLPYGTQAVGGLLEAFLADVMSDRGACVYMGFNGGML